MTPILAMDLGKFKTVACSYDPACPGTARFRTVSTNVETLEKLLDTEQPRLVVFETCTIAGWVHEVCERLNVPCMVANPNGEAWRWKNVKRKTDRDDALKLARLAAGDELAVVTMPCTAVRQKRALLKYRQGIIGQRVAVQNHLRHLAEAQGRRLAPGYKAWTRTGIAVLSGWARPLAECSEEELWRGQLHQALQWFQHLDEQEAALNTQLEQMAETDAAIRRLRTIPGVGRRIAEVVVNYLPDPHRFRRAAEVSAYAGFVPRQYQSGEQDRRGRISKRGPALLRKMLVEGAWGLLRFNAWAARLFQRLTKGQKTRRKVAIVAVARKLLVHCWALLRHGTDWREPAAALGT
jgi:transposase